MENVKCPKCGSVQITADKHGYSAGKALVAGALTGGVGLLAGFHGSKKIDITCLSCGNRFKPGETSKSSCVITDINSPTTRPTKFIVQINSITVDEMKYKGLESAIGVYKFHTGLDYKSAKNKVIDLANYYGIDIETLTKDPKKEVSSNGTGVAVGIFIVIVIGLIILIALN